MDNYAQTAFGITDENIILDGHYLEVGHKNHEEIYIIKGKYDKDCKWCLHCHNKNIIKHTSTFHEIILPLIRVRKTYYNILSCLSFLIGIK